jgi:hypothetical protein
VPKETLVRVTKAEDGGLPASKPLGRRQPGSDGEALNRAGGTLHLPVDV